MRSSSISGSAKAKLRRLSRCESGRERVIDIEGHLRQAGYHTIAGVDEAGRGPLAGPVVAAAVILGNHVPGGIKDSKKLTAHQRSTLAQAIGSSAVDIGVGIVAPAVIDRLNVLEATRLAMKQALESLSVAFDCAIIDGDVLPDVDVPAVGVVRGDSLCPSVAAASIVAKVVRDRWMVSMDVVYPHYNFKSNKGYGTKGHMEALRRFGPSRIHRYSFEPVLRFLEGRS